MPAPSPSSRFLVDLGGRLEALRRGVGRPRRRASSAVAALGRLEVDDVAQQHAPGLERVVPGDDGAEGQRALAQPADHHVAAGLDALGDGDLALARQQLDAAHLAQVHADRVVGAAEAFLVDVAGRPPRSSSSSSSSRPWRRGLGLLALLALDDLDAHLAEHRHDVLDLLGAVLVGRQHGVQLVEGDVAALLAPRDQPLDGGRLVSSRVVSPSCSAGGGFRSSAVLVAMPLNSIRLPSRRLALPHAATASADARLGHAACGGVHRPPATGRACRSPASSCRLLAAASAAQTSTAPACAARTAVVAVTQSRTAASFVHQPLAVQQPEEMPPPRFGLGRHGSGLGAGRAAAWVAAGTSDLRDNPPTVPEACESGGQARPVGVKRIGRASRMCSGDMGMRGPSYQCARSRRRSRQIEAAIGLLDVVQQRRDGAAGWRSGMRSALARTVCGSGGRAVGRAGRRAATAGRPARGRRRPAACGDGSKNRSSSARRYSRGQRPVGDRARPPPRAGRAARRAAPGRSLHRPRAAASNSASTSGARAVQDRLERGAAPRARTRLSGSSPAGSAAMRSVARGPAAAAPVSAARAGGAPAGGVAVEAQHRLGREPPQRLELLRRSARCRAARPRRRSPPDAARSRPCSPRPRPAGRPCRGARLAARRGRGAYRVRRLENSGVSGPLTYFGWPSPSVRPPKLISPAAAVADRERDPVEEQLARRPPVLGPPHQPGLGQQSRRRSPACRARRPARRARRRTSPGRSGSIVSSDRPRPRR